MQRLQRRHKSDFQFSVISDRILVNIWAELRFHSARNPFNPALVLWDITNPSHIFCYAIMVFGNNVFFPPVYLHLI
jgi:hypothetical protein